ncbi:hypothetical protein QBC34DRAFT_395204 [Podospora aff. communis PSN243]|uniref:Uncharacterized protein n=1 Tax=Podospora aff. communis PSN243 TaxID=3040156 RepID=A0AAV9GZE0_9PEZI|nr:hypothetical protein QBC34DRAFT_395204 [Podospora aff. communis PSN243]
MSGHQDPHPEACGCFLFHGRMSQVITCQACQGSHRTDCRHCGNSRLMYIDCDHYSRNNGRRRASNYRGNGSRGSGSGSHSMQGGHHQGGSHGHGSSVST